MPTAVIVRAILSVRSVCPSVTFRCFVQKNEDTIVRFSASGRKIILVSGELNKIYLVIRMGSPPAKAFKVKQPLIASENLTKISHNL